jgi:glycosyltransferase involved in cell wall biosynthesis
MKAQIYGAVPVVVNYAALETTVKYGIKIDGDIYDSETKAEFQKQLIELLQDESRQEEIRQPMMEWARKEFPWSKVADQWTKEMESK